MAAYTAVNATIKEGVATLAQIVGFRLNESAAVRSFQSNMTSGRRKTAAGGKDASGSFDYIVDTTLTKDFDAGDEITMIFDFDGTDTNKITGVMRITDVSFSCEIDANGLVGGTANFVGSGSFTKFGDLLTA